MNKKIDILTIGDCSVDLYMRVSDSSFTEDLSDADQPKTCFIHGEKIPVDEFDTSIAGNSLNVAMSARLLGLNTEIYTETGKDDNSKRLLNELKDIGVSTRLIKRNENTRTDVHAIIVFGGERTIFSYHGKRNYKLQQWGTPKFIYYTSIGKGFENFQKELIGYLNNNPQVGVIFNPGTFQLKAGNDHLYPVLAVSDVIFLNREEALELTELDKTYELLEIHKKLQTLGPKLTVITDAQRGATAYDGTNLFSQKSYSDTRPIADKTGAGDAFAAAFTSALIYGKSIPECLKWGAANAGNLIKEVGATNGLLNKKEIEVIAGKNLTNMAKAIEILTKANKEHYAVGAFNVANLESLKAVTSAANKLRSPIIMEASDGEVNYIGYKQLAQLKAIYEEEINVPIILNLDHGKDFDSCIKAIDAGFDYVHIDGSKMEYEECVAQSKEVVKAAHNKGILVEGEMDHIEGSSADHTDMSPDVWAKSELFTNPDKAYDFINRTGIDVFASFIGNLHGIYAEPKKLNLDILRKIKEKLPNTMLSLHGGSGIIEQDVKEAIKLGIVKVNVNSELRAAFKFSLQEVLSSSNEIAVYKIMEKPIAEIQKVVEYKIKMFGSENKA